MSQKTFNIILATDSTGGIGLEKDGQFTIPWAGDKGKTQYASIDLRNFSNLTSYRIPGSTIPNTLILGRNTWDTMKHLKFVHNRKLIVISSQPFDTFQELPDIARSLPEALEKAWMSGSGKVFLIGGKRIFEEGFRHPGLDKVYLSVFSGDFGCNIRIDPNLLKMIREGSQIHWKSPEFQYMINNVAASSTYITATLPERGCGGLPHFEEEYLNVLRKLLGKPERMTRNGLCRSMFSRTIEVDLREEFPLVTTKSVRLSYIFEELMWFIRGQTDVRILQEKGVTVWNGNTSPEFREKSGKSSGEPWNIGPMYGFQWRNFGGKDQLQECLRLIREDPESRRILMTSYNPAQADEGVLYPCHGIVIQFYVEDREFLHLSMYQRSADWFLGVVWNFASYALLVHLMCGLDGFRHLRPGRVIYHFGDIHLYSVHEAAAITQLLRIPDRSVRPKVNIIRSPERIEDYEFGDIELVGYYPQSFIKADMVA